MRTKTGLKAGQMGRNNTATVNNYIAQNSGDGGEATAG
jgi:hypothetical protein